MAENKSHPLWRTSVCVRISHPELDIHRISDELNTIPTIADLPGQSRVRHGDCRSAGYWCKEHCIAAPDKPSEAFTWVELFVADRQSQIQELLEKGCAINIYIAIFTSILDLGFELPATPVLWKLDIPVGMEIFSSETTRDDKSRTP